MKTILVIEDNPDNMKMITFILEKNGYKTLSAFTGKDGIDLAKMELPDLILLDIQLPDMDGTDVLKAIRNSDTDIPLPIVAVTSYAMSGDRQKLLAAGCNGYLEKPINPGNIVEEIKTYLGELS